MVYFGLQGSPVKDLFKQNRWFYKHLFSYLLLLVVTLAIINGVFGKRINATYQAEVMRRLESDILALRDTLDGELRTMVTTANQFQLLGSANRYYFEEDPLGANAIKAILGMFTLTNRIVDDIIYIPCDQEYLFTSSTTSKIDFFAKELYVANYLTPSDFVDRLKHLDHLQIFSVKRHKKDRGLAIAIPLVTDYATIRGAFLFFVSDGTLEAVIKPHLIQYNASLFIQADDGTTLFSYGQSDSFEGTFDFFASSTLVPWKVAVTIFQEQSLLDDLNQLSNMQQTSTIIAVLTVSMLIFFLMFVNYSPIRKLQKIAGNLVDAPHDGPKLGELEEIARTLHYLKNQNITLSEKVERAQESEQNIALQRLLSGRYERIEHFNDEATGLSIPLDKPYFLVASIHVHDLDTDIEELAELIRDELPEPLSCYYVFTPIPDRICFINTLRQEELARLPTDYETMRKAVEAQAGTSLTVGLGSAYHQSEDIVRSFLESRTALDYQFIKGKNTTILFEEVYESTNFTAFYPKALLDQLSLALKSLDKEEIEHHTGDLIEYLKQDNIPLFFARSISLDIIRLFAGHLPPSLQNIKEEQKDIFLLSEIDTIEEVIQLVLSAKETLVNCEIPRQAELNEGLMHSIIEYVKEHCFSCDFSMIQVADHFNLHLPALSVMFKEHVKITFLDYVTSLRMDFAKQLLRETDLPLKDVSLQVGYYNISSFIRRFKQIHAITPGDYRKLQAEG